MMDQTDFDVNRNLIVNYLPTTLSQDDVKEIFLRIGPVSNCKLVRNNATGQSLGYAFIEYPDEDSAACAIAQVNGIQMQGKTIKVSYARKSTPEIKNANVYIAGLPHWVTEDKLLSLFSSFGSVLSHKVLANPDGSSRGAGFVRYNLNSEATEAIQQMAGKLLPDSTGPLAVKLAIPPASKQDSLQALSVITTNALAGVGVANRTSNVRFNPLASSNQMLINNGIGQPQQMVNHNPVSHVQSGGGGGGGIMNHHVGNGAGIIQQQPMLPASVYVFGLQEKHSELTMYELFSPFGGILNVKLIRDLTKDDKPCKGYGFVNFAKQEEAAKAVASMNGVLFEERILQVSFKQNKNATHTQNPVQMQGYTSAANNNVFRKTFNSNGAGRMGMMNVS